MPLMGIGRSKLVKFSYNNYTDTYSTIVVPGGGTPATYKITGVIINTLADPGPSDVGITIAGVTEWSAFYTEYRVEFVTIESRFINSNDFPIDVTWQFQRTGMESPTTWPEIRELRGQPWVKFITLNGIGSGNNIKTMKASFPLWKLLGDKSTYEGDESWTSGGFTSSPSNIMYYNEIISVCDNIDLVADAYVICERRITLWTKLFNPKRLYISGTFDEPLNVASAEIPMPNVQKLSINSNSSMTTNKMMLSPRRGK